MPGWRLGLAALLLVATAAAALSWREVALPPPGPAPADLAYHPELARVWPLEVGAGLRLRSGWTISPWGGVQPIAWSVVGWQPLGGVPHARVEYVFTRLRGRTDLYAVEWLRPEGDRLLCARRQIGQRTFQLDPPQPVLVRPLAPGASWAWSGRSGDLPASATFRVLEAGERDGREVVRVEQVTRVAGAESWRVVTYAAGAGLVGEEARLPIPITGEPSILGVRPFREGEEY